MSTSGEGYALSGLLWPRIYRGDNRLVRNLPNDALPLIVDDLLFTPAGAGAQSLSPGLFTNTAAFYAATLAPGAVTLAPGRFDNAAAFYAATLAPGAVTLAPGRFDNAGTFYAASISQASGAQTLSPARFDNAGAFYTAALAPGAVTLSPARFDSEGSFYAAAVGRGAITLAPGRIDNLPTFYAAVCVVSVPLPPSADRFDYVAAAALPNASPMLARMAAQILLTQRARRDARRR